MIDYDSKKKSSSDTSEQMKRSISRFTSQNTISHSARMNPHRFKNSHSGSLLFVDSPSSHAEQEAKKFASPFRSSSSANFVESSKPATLFASGVISGFALDEEQKAKVESGLKSSARPLPEGQRESLESAPGYDLGNVQVHTGSQAEKAAEAIQAKAFTLGNDIVFGKDEYRPGTREGDHLIAHEVAHVAQGNNQVISRAPEDGKASPIPHSVQNFIVKVAHTEIEIMVAFWKLSGQIQAYSAGVTAGYLDAQSFGLLHKKLYTEALRRTPKPELYAAGFLTGSLATTGQGFLEMLGGVIGEMGGVTLDATGVGALAGVPINIASAALITHGYLTTVAGVAISLDTLQNIMMMKGKGGGGQGDIDFKNEPSFQGFEQRTKELIKKNNRRRELEKSGKLSRDENKSQTKIIHEDKVKLKDDIRKFIELQFENKNVPGVQLLRELLRDLEPIVFQNLPDQEHFYV